MSATSVKQAHFIPSPQLVPRYVRSPPRPTPNLLAPELERYLTGLNRTSKRERLDIMTAAVYDLDRYPLSPSMISSAEGRIKKMLLAIPLYVVTDEWLQPVFADFVRKLPADTDLVVVTPNDEVKIAVKAWPDFDNGKRTVQWVDSTDPLLFSMWAEDAYVSVKDQGTTYLVEPLEFFRYGDAILAELVAKRGIGIQQAQAPLYFQGGNVLVGDKFVLMGQDYTNRTLTYVDTAFPRETGETPEVAVQRLYHHYLDRVRTVGYVGTQRPIPQWKIRLTEIDGHQWIEELFCGNWLNTTQPIFHIDMFLTLAGRDPDGERKYRVLVGDPRLAAEILDVPLPPDAIPEAFDDIADELRELQFHVIRNPLPMVYHPFEGEHAWTQDKVSAYQRQGVDGADDVLKYMLAHHLDQLPARVWYFASANNALVQWNGPDASEVWLPTYGYRDWETLAATDDYNRAIWEKLKYTVHMLGDFHPVAVRGGAAHCIKKYLARG